MFQLKFLDLGAQFCHAPRFRNRKELDHESKHDHEEANRDECRVFRIYDSGSPVICRCWTPCMPNNHPSMSVCA